MADVGSGRAIVITNFVAGTILLLKIKVCGLSVSHKYVDTGSED